MILLGVIIGMAQKLFQDSDQRKEDDRFINNNFYNWFFKNF